MQRSQSTSTGLALILALAGMLTACGGGGDDDGSGLTSGQWHGSTAQGKTLSFTIEDDVLTQARFAYNTAGAGCRARVSTTLTDLSERIVDGSLSGSFATGGLNPDTIIYNLRFTSGNTATGSLAVSGACGTASTTFTAEPGAATNSMPVARAGEDQTVSVGRRVTLDGSASDDAENDILTPEWALTPPAGSSARLDDPNSMQPSFTPDVPGAYQLRLTVDDGLVDSTADTVVVNAAE